MCAEIAALRKKLLSVVFCIQGSTSFTVHLALVYFFQKCRLTGKDNAVRQCFIAYFMFWEGIFISTSWPRFWNSRQFHKQQQLCAKRGLELLRIEVPYGIHINVYI